ncbi:MULTISPECIES: DUF6113 family protein [Streptomyces]|uniref:DUF6113 family protein n=1 Tax=Streptomyces chengmaiensis TaxID=3040919 RepID=A0ABT6HZ44_9ACTN|nr:MULTISPECIES: DUF6113 family protein [Streptomyces]MDH2393989.1 DUF6113 family protein [Streptomyces chengmaiensis]WRQ81477.1 DUF6113 family protein [Streptomyces sp. MUM 178J]
MIAFSPARIALYAALLLLGLAVGTAGSLVQGGWFPGGLLLALLGSGGLFYGATRATGTQLGTLVSAGGWLLAILLLNLGRPEGDGAFTAGLGPLLFMLGGMVLAVMCATLTRPAQPGD